MQCVRIIFACKKKTFQSLDRSDDQGPQCKSINQVRNNSFGESFFLKFSQVTFFEETRKSTQDVIGDLYCPTCANEKCFHLSTYKSFRFCDCKRCKACFHVLNSPFKDRKPTISMFGCDCTHWFAKAPSRDWEKRNPFPLLKNVLRQL